MKKNKIILPAMTFILGLLFGVTLLVFMSFSESGVTRTPSQGLTVISAADANSMLKNYLKTATISTTPIKGFFLDTLQVNAMKLLAKENAALSGFRIYLGKDKSNTTVGIVVGVDNRGLDATSNTIYRTSSVKAGPCPFVCDVNSTISKD